MRDRALPILARTSDSRRGRLPSRRPALLALTLLLAPVGCIVIGPATAARAQDAILQVTVRSAVPGGGLLRRATVRLDSETERTQSRLTDIAGLAVFPRIAPGAFNVVVSAVGFASKTVPLTLAAGASTQISVTLSPLGPENLGLTSGIISRLNREDTRQVTIRDRQFYTDFPLAAGNRQNLSRILRSVPGVAYDSINRFYPRGEDTAAPGYRIDGAVLPQYAQGRAAAFLLPDSLDSFEAVTGGFSPEYAGSGLVLDTTTRRIPAYRQPTLDAAVRLGEYNTTEDYLTFGDRVLPAGSLRNKSRVAQARADARAGRRPTIGYIITASQRYTDNALEAPQDSNQKTHNYGASEIFFGKFDYTINPRSTLGATVNFSSGRTDLANRTGQTSISPQYGQGFGFGGANSALSGLPSQAQAGQNERQKDNNNLTKFQIDHTFKNGTLSRITVGASRSTLETVNFTRNGANLASLPTDNSVEYNPYVLNDYEQVQAQIDYTLPRSRTNHRPKFGVVYHDLTGRETYILSPQSQLALDALHAVDPRLAPDGGTVTGGVDVLGYPVYQFLNPASIGPVPVLRVQRTGYYAGGYAQDTFRPRRLITINYGVRLDSYQQTIKSYRLNPTGTASAGGVLPSVSKTDISPRINIAFEFPQTGRNKIARLLGKQPTVARASYNRLFAPPGLNQGNFVGKQGAEGFNGISNGNAAQPQTTDQYDVSVERQLSGSRVIKLAFYNKDIKNFLSSQQLIPGLESGVFSVLNAGHVVVDGSEVSLDLFAPTENNVGLRGYLVYASSSTHAKDRFQVNSLGYNGGGYGTRQASAFTDTDQTDTLSLGIAYNTKTGTAAGFNWYYGSGLYSSALRQYNSPVRAGNRQPINEVNFRLASGPTLFHKQGSVEVQVENLFGSKARLNDNSLFSGTRYQQGRRVFLVVNGKF